MSFTATWCMPMVTYASFSPMAAGSCVARLSMSTSSPQCCVACVWPVNMEGTSKQRHFTTQIMSCIRRSRDMMQLIKACRQSDLLIMNEVDGSVIQISMAMHMSVYSCVQYLSSVHVSW